MTVEVVAVISDVHHPHVHLKTWRAFRAWHRDVRPSRTIVAGDFFDLPMISSHAPEPDQGVEMLPPLRTGSKMLNELEAECGELCFTPGNHEGRWAKQLMHLAHQLRGMEECVSLEALCRAHGLSPTINWVNEDPKKEKAPFQVGQFGIRHGHKQGAGGRTPTAALLHKDAGVANHSLVMGHFHRPQIYTCGDRTFVVNAHMEAPVAFTGGVDGWTRGWTVLLLDTETDKAQVVPMWSNTARFIWEGRVYDGAAEGSTVGAAALAFQPPVAEHPKQEPHGGAQCKPLDRSKVHQPVESRFHVRSWEAGGKRHLRFVLPNEHGRWVPMNTAQVARWAGMESGWGSALVRDRIKAWERITGEPIESITFEEFEELARRPCA